MCVFTNSACECIALVSYVLYSCVLLLDPMFDTVC